MPVWDQRHALQATRTHAAVLAGSEPTRPVGAARSMVVEEESRTRAVPRSERSAAPAPTDAESELRISCERRRGRARSWSCFRSAGGLRERGGAARGSGGSGGVAPDAPGPADGGSVGAESGGEPEGGFCAMMRMRFRNLALPRGGGAPAPPEVAAPKFRPAPGLRSDLGRRCARGRRPEGRRRRLLPASHNPARAGGLCVARPAAGEGPRRPMQRRRRR